jgi:hypothetical protein
MKTEIRTRPRVVLSNRSCSDFRGELASMIRLYSA